MGVCVIRKRVKKALSKSNLPGVDYTVNPYIGCAHGCVYCYARLYSPGIGERWGEVVVVKENIDKLREIRRRVDGRIVLSTITDPYQPVEKEEELTRKVLQILLNSGCRVGIQTKSNLVLRDIDLLAQNVEIVDVGFTITTTDEKLAAKIEPNAPLPVKRVRALERLSEEGIKTWIFLGPVIPGLDEDEIASIVDIARATRSTLYYDKFRVKGFMKEGVVRELAEKAREVNWRDVEKKIQEICEKMGVNCVSAFGRV